MTDKNQTYAVDQMAELVVRADQSDLGGQVLPTLKRNVLDSIACALGALDGELIRAIRAHAEPPVCSAASVLRPSTREPGDGCNGPTERLRVLTILC